MLLTKRAGRPIVVLFVLIFVVLVSGCTQNLDQCVSDSDCKEGQCIHGECISIQVSGCSSDNNCLSNQTCQDTNCISNNNYSDSETVKNQLVDKLENKEYIFPNSPAESNFFKGDKTAEKILLGEITNYSINEFNDRIETSNNTFAFKVLNALKIIGYTFVSTEYKDTYYAYLKENNFTKSDIVSKNALGKIDLELSEKEKFDSQKSREMPLYSEFIEENIEGDVNKNHLVSLLTQGINLLPSNLVDWNQHLSSFFDETYFSGKTSRKCNNKCLISFSKYYYGQLNPWSDSNGNVGKSWSLKDDFSTITTIIHEYGHFLDSELKVSDGITKRGSINTTEFYSISYDVGDTKEGYFKPRNGVIDNKEENFVSGYAASGFESEKYQGYYTPYEDFAESFAMYVFAGNVFRCKAGKYSSISQKYNWLKTNVFNGEEYSYNLASDCGKFYFNHQAYITNPNFVKFDFADIVN